MQRAHKIRLNPTPEQEAYLRQAVGVARFAYNWARAAWLEHKAAFPDEACGVFALKAEFNSIKAEQFPWVYNVTKSAAEGGFRNFATALKNYFDSRRGQRAGKPVGFPKWKSKKTARQTFYLANDRFGIVGHDLTIQKLATPINLAEPLRFAGKIMSGTVCHETDGHWYIAVNVELAEPVISPAETDTLVGVDVGVKTLMVLSDGTQVENQAPLRHELSHLKRLQRRLARRKAGSRRRQRAKQAVARHHARIRRRRLDTLHKATTAIAARYETVVIEDLNIAGMVKNRHLSLSLSDAAFGEIARQLAYKARRVVFVDRFFPSSRLCEACGLVNDGLVLAYRTFVCPACGHRADRDQQAARNIAREGRRLLAAM